MIGIGNLALDLAIPFEAGGMDTSGFTVAAGTPQGRRARPAGEAAPYRWTGLVATWLWGAACALVA
jgi:hypothetical protein